MVDKKIVAKARKASLVEFFNRQGYRMESVDSKRGTQYKIDSFGGLFVRDNMFYQFSTEISGNSIECLMNILGYKFKDAVLELSKDDYVMENPLCVYDEPKALLMPERANNVRRIYSYLINTRGLDPSIVSLMIQHKLLYQDRKGNAIFVHKDNNGQPIGGEIQGTNTSVRFKGIVEGTNLSAFEIEKGTPDKFFLFESVIDLLSYLQMNRYDENETNVLYVSMAGLKKEIVHKYLARGLKGVSKVDNDEAGIRFNKVISLELEYPGIQVFQDQKHAYVYGKTDADVFVFPDERDYEFYKESLQFNSENMRIIGESSNFVIDTHLSEFGVKDWNDLIKKLANPKVDNFNNSGEIID
jgi:Protein of unknown function (DUF3991)/Toprim-like